MATNEDGACFFPLCLLGSAAFCYFNGQFLMQARKEIEIDKKKAPWNHLSQKLHGRSPKLMPSSVLSRGLPGMHLYCILFCLHALL